MDAATIVGVLALLGVYTGSIAGVVIYHNRSQAGMHARVNTLKDKLHEFEKEVGKDYTSIITTAKMEERLTKHMDARFDGITSLINATLNQKMHDNITPKSA